MMTSVSAQHEKIKAFDWEPSYFRRDARYPTKYKVPPRTKDPFRTLVREYVQMEREKDDRQYGSLEDVLARMSSAGQAQPRFIGMPPTPRASIRVSRRGAWIRSAGRAARCLSCS